MLVSVICTVRNGENTISYTIDSVINQTFKEWEMIIIDDGSTDRTAVILKEYQSKDKRIKVISSGGMGRAKSLNMAINNAKGEYIANIDADDLMHPEKLECQVDIISENKSFFLVSTLSELIYDDEKPNWKDIKCGNNLLTFIDHKLLFRNRISHSSVLINKNELIKLGAYNIDRKSQLDYELWLRALLSNKKMGIIESKLTAKRIHSNQSFENKKRLKYTYNSMLLQMKFMILSKQYIYYLPLPVISFFVSLLPFSYRRKISSIVFKEK
ncbi:glycosyltransferase family 2 protein [Ammoniphilus resinae]|uniref:Glycosyltransferase involved in cell wall biosynthesis n=1 Tax=Ammoniphilus resinae TaxID=861532 RepID=A0ABS4GXJ0_9BACL|nr:glycosyltransferase [Ammoniphilus resinae]MBP1934982.1 glycosyltransferase involved in cell wall biosynthesis [Ammoniphilus resinae]